jgi:hypothetical protein
LDSKVNTEVEGLFALRTDLVNNQGHISTFNSCLSTLLKTYESSMISKENYPFGISETSGKETLFQFISRFCISEHEFDIVAFENCVQKITAQKPNVPNSFGDFYQDNTILFPIKSLYLTRYPQENVFAEKEKEKNDIILATKKDLSDLKNDIQV